jgi:hypothetical protein
LCPQFSRRQRWTFEEAIELLDRKLRALGLRTTAPPPNVPEE